MASVSREDRMHSRVAGIFIHERITVILQSVFESQSTFPVLTYIDNILYINKCEILSTNVNIGVDEYIYYARARAYI